LLRWIGASTLVRTLLKRLLQATALLLAWPCALATGFGRIRPAFTFFAQAFALFPGVPGDFLRAALYRLTLRRCSIDVVISFGSYVSSPAAEVGSHVSIGAFCVIGYAKIGERTQIASHVQIPSGRRQHIRTADGTLHNTTGDVVSVGARCWIGASAVVLASVGDDVTVGAGAVVVKPIPAGTVAVGNPARPLARPAAD
jgi:acetyltransferase-like isoleucine patch superfamily enzyme